MATTQERFTAVPIGAGKTIVLTGQSIGGFMCTADGDITVVDAKGTTIIDALTVVSGTWYPLPFYLQGAGGTFTTANSAAGTIAA